MAAPRKKSSISWKSFFLKIGPHSRGCWPWVGACSSTGYGMHHSGNASHLAHRLSFEFFNGPIPEGHCICHRCDNPLCVNPSHLFAGTHEENLQDMRNKGRAVDRRGEGRKNHKLTESQVKAILALPRDYSGRYGDSFFTWYSNIAAQYGCSPETIRLILCRRKWKHVEVDAVCNS